MTAPLPTNAILYFFSQPGCAHCAFMRPVVEQYRQKYQGQLFIYELDANKHPGVDDYVIQATPAFALKVNSILVATREGVMSLAQLEKFVERGVAGKESLDEDRPARNDRRKPQGRRQASGTGGDPPPKRKRRSGTGAGDDAAHDLADGDDGADGAPAD